jgi:hypothetical protein
MAGVMLVTGLCRSCQGHAAFDKASVGGFLSSLPAWTSGDEDASRLLVQPALRLKLASSAGCHSNPWDISQQMAMPLAYTDSHPHDNKRGNHAATRSLVAKAFHHGFYWPTAKTDVN